MIRLHKGPQPPVLEERGAEWAEEYARHRQDDPGVPAAAAIRYRNSAIKTAVLEEAHGKCIYCESPVRHVSPGDIEHILPKSKFPELVVDWDNLAYVCAECNRAKSDYFVEHEEIVNPFIEDPVDFLIFFGPIVLSSNGSIRGFVTQKVLDLDRVPLVERRTELIRSIERRIGAWSNLPPGTAKDEMAKEIRALAQDDAPYAATVRSLLRQTGPDA